LYFGPRWGISRQRTVTLITATILTGIVVFAGFRQIANSLGTIDVSGGIDVSLTDQ